MPSLANIRFGPDHDRPRRLVGIAVAVVLVMLGAAVARGETVIAIRDLKPIDLEHRSFTMFEDGEIHIEAVGAGWESGDQLFCYPWIIDARTRNLVWSLDEDITEPIKDEEWLCSYDDVLDLPQGSYELYYFAGHPMFFPGGFNFDELGDALRWLGLWLKKKGNGKYEFDQEEFLKKLAPRLFVQLSAPSATLREESGPIARDALVGLVHPENDSYRQQGFALSDDLDVEVYGLGEYASGSEAMVDWGWIIDARTRHRVWEMDPDIGEPAGGAEKNLRFQERIHLPKGEYIAFYVTDDSHTYGDWNAPPPADPEAWGLQVLPVNPADRAKVTLFEDTRWARPILLMTGIGDNELRSEAFRLKRPLSLRIYALGEYDRYDETMADYAWITGADGRKVWAMDGDNTEPAGGSSKNRQFDGTVDLDAGDYVVYYSSDGSHSEGGGWNTSPPYDQKAYGVSLYLASTDADPGDFAPINQEQMKAPGVLAQITAVRSDQELHRRFTLSSPTRVCIRAVGEGDRSEMYDYGWIEDESTGDIVWEMTYRKTTHAGGGEKNRRVEQTILLDKGEYTVHYVTDGSHAFGDWNTAPPDDPMEWGIVVSEAAKSGP